MNLTIRPLCIKKFCTYRSSSGIHNVSYDETTPDGTVPSLHRSDSPPSLLPEAVSSEAGLPVARALVSYDLPPQICGQQRVQPLQEDGHLPSLSAACEHIQSVHHVRRYFPAYSWKL